MAAPLWFFANTAKADLVDAQSGQINLDLLRERGVAGPFVDCRPGEFASPELRTTGPGNHGGTILDPAPPDRRSPRCGFYPDAQEWTDLGNGVWIGRDLLSPLKPADVARRAIHPGYDVRLASGDRWTVPIVRVPTGGTTLPYNFWRDATGQFHQAVKPAYQELWERASAIFEIVQASGVVVWDLPEILDYCTAVLAVNYRIDAAVQSVFHIMDSESWMPIVQASLDWPAIVAAMPDEEKKTLESRKEIVLVPTS